MQGFAIGGFGVLILGALFMQEYFSEVKSISTGVFVMVIILGGLAGAYMEKLLKKS